MEEVTINLPVLPLLPQQQISYEAILNNEKHYSAISAHRRFGKDVCGLSVITSFLLKNPNSTGFYVAPYRKQIKEIIIEGKLYNGMNMIDLIPDEIVEMTDRGNKVKNDDLSIKFINGSRLVFIGADNINGVVGVGATAVVFTEFAMISPIFYQLFRPIVSRAIEDNGVGFMMFISTPRGINNHFTQLFKKFLPKTTDTELDKKIKNKWLLQWIPATLSTKLDGSRLLSDEFLEEEKMNMGEEAFEQEYMLALTSSGKSVWYGKQLDEMVKTKKINTFGITVGGRYTDFTFRGIPCYVSWDLGVADATVLSFWQINPNNNKPRLIHVYREHGKTFEHYKKYIDEFQRTHYLANIINILPHDSNQRSIVSYGNSSTWNDNAIKRVDILRGMGLNCVVLDKNELGLEKMRIITRINTVRKILPECEIDEVSSNLGLVGLRGYVKKWSRTQNTYLDIPDHDANDKASDIADSIGYFVLYYENKLRNKISGIVSKSFIKYENIY
ncbi:MAG: terminase large subunit domain-containing protein [Fusobacteriaceae bacterium]